MVEQGTPRGFDLAEQNAVVRIEEVRLHHRLEADADARLRKHVWIEAVAVPAVAFATMTLDLHFVLWDGDAKLGTCCNHGLTIDGETDRLAIVADSALRIGQNVDVSRMELQVTATTVNRFAKATLDPAPFPPIDGE